MKIHSLYNFSFWEGHRPQSMQHQERHTGSGKTERSHADRSAKSILVIHGEERKGSQAAVVFCLPWKTCTKLRHPRVNISKAHPTPPSVNIWTFFMGGTHHCSRLCEWLLFQNPPTASSVLAPGDSCSFPWIGINISLSIKYMYVSLYTNIYMCMWVRNRVCIHNLLLL